MMFSAELLVKKPPSRVQQQSLIAREQSDIVSGTPTVQHNYVSVSLFAFLSNLLQEDMSEYILSYLVHHNNSN